MDGENKGSKPYEQMDDLGVALFLVQHPYLVKLARDRKHGSPDLLPPKGSILEGKWHLI